MRWGSCKHKGRKSGHLALEAPDEVGKGYNADTTNHCPLDMNGEGGGWGERGGITKVWEEGCQKDIKE
jgi:hypothetical protein